MKGSANHIASFAELERKWATEICLRWDVPLIQLNCNEKGLRLEDFLQYERG